MASNIDSTAMIQALLNQRAATQYPIGYPSQYPTPIDQEPTGMTMTHPYVNGQYSQGTASVFPGRARSAGVADPNQMGVIQDPRMGRAGNEIYNYDPVGDNRVGQPPYSTTAQGIRYINSIPGTFDATYPVPVPGSK